MTPAEELRAAAAKLREMAAAATAGPWTTGPEISGLKDVYGPDGAHVAGGDWPVAVLADAEWIALMCPDKAEPLADLIDEAGDLAHFAAVMEGGRVRESSLSILERTALKFARAILGGPAS